MSGGCAGDPGQVGSPLWTWLSSFHPLSPRGWPAGLQRNQEAERPLGGLEGRLSRSGCGPHPWKQSAGPLPPTLPFISCLGEFYFFSFGRRKSSSVKTKLELTKSQ